MQEIQGGVVSAFQILLMEPGDWRPSLNGLDFDKTGVEEATRLEEVFIVEEVFSALSELNEDKGPSSDGFSIAFWQFCLESMKNEVMGFFKEFHKWGRFVSSLNIMFFVLVPKNSISRAVRRRGFL